MRWLSTMTCVATLLVASAAPADDRLVRVHIVSKTPGVVLETRGAFVWNKVCEAPCDVRVPTDRIYRVAGPGIQSSEKLTLSGVGSDAVWLTVNTASSSVHASGILLVSLGGAGIGLGLLTLATGALAENCSNCVAGFADTTVLNVGWTMVAVSAVMLLVGLGVFSASKTSVTSPLTDASLLDSKRAPETERKLMPPAGTSFPVLTIVF